MTLFISSIHGRGDIARVACVCGKARSRFRVPCVSSTSIGGILSYLAIYLCLRVLPRIVSRHVATLRPITVHLRIGSKQANYAVVGSYCGSSFGSLSVTLSFVGHHPSGEKEQHILVLDSVTRSNRLPSSLCNHITHLIRSQKISIFIKIKPYLITTQGLFPVGTRFFTSARSLVSSSLFAR